jgi:sugar/nucleoside kinase (ribokinase family)
MHEILRFSNACGALATQKAGAIPALPTAGQVEVFLRDAKHISQSPHPS